MSISIAELLDAYHAPSDWVPDVLAYAEMDLATLSDYLACFFRHQLSEDRHFSEGGDTGGLELPAWARDPESSEYSETRDRLMAEHGWEAYSDLGVVVHSELMARDPYKVPIHEAWLEALDGRATDGFHILDVGAGTSSYTALARRVHSGVRATLAEVHPGLCEYLRWKHREDPGVDVVELRTIAPKITTQHRVHIDLGSIPGSYDSIVLGDVLEHALDPLAMLLGLRRKLRGRGPSEPELWMIAFASYIEGDWHTPEAFYLRPWCLRLLTRTARKVNKFCWLEKHGTRARVTNAAFGMASPMLSALSRRFTRSYFRQHGEKLCEEVRGTGREVTVDELLASVGAA